MFWLLLLKALYFFLPAYCANMAPTLFKWIPLGNKPIYEKKLGSHKTWRGLIAGTIFGGIIFALQKYLYQQGLTPWSLIDYNGFSLLLGLLMGFGALAGDIVKSYYKRKAGIPVGVKWIPWDQMDFAIGGLIFTWFVWVPPAEVALIILVISPFLHIIVNHIGYWLKIRKEKW